MTDHKRRVDELEKQAADRGDAETPVVPDDPTDLPHSPETYFLRALEHTSHPPYRDLSAEGMDGDDRENDVGPYPHAAERYLALKRANGDYPPEGEDRDVPEHVADSQLEGDNSESE